MKPIITVFTVIALSFSINAWALNDDDALMLYFTFDQDDGGKVKDVSGNNLEGTLEGAVWSKDGKFGGAVHLEDTEKFVEVDAVPELDITDELTIQAWYFPEESQPDSNLMGRRSGANVGGYCLQWSAQFTGAPQIETWINIGDIKFGDSINLYKLFGVFKVDSTTELAIFRPDGTFKSTFKVIPTHVLNLATIVLVKGKIQHECIVIV